MGFTLNPYIHGVSCSIWPFNTNPQQEAVHGESDSVPEADPVKSVVGRGLVGGSEFRIGV